jgi:hypothetical protein
MEKLELSGGNGPEIPDNLESQTANKELDAPAYNLYSGDEIVEKLSRQLKYIAIGGVVGSALGISVGIIISSQVELTSKLAIDLSMGISGLVIGSVAGSAIEYWTASKR